MRAIVAVLMFVAAMVSEGDTGEPGIAKAVARDEHGAELLGTVRWQTVPARVGIDGGDGGFAAGEAGMSAVRATIVPGVLAASGSAANERGSRTAVAVQEGLTLEISPRQASVRPGESVDFRGYLRVDANRRTDVGAVRWSVVPQELGTIGEDGHFVAGAGGMEGRVEATLSLDDRILRSTASVAVRAYRST